MGVEIGLSLILAYPHFYFQRCQNRKENKMMYWSQYFGCWRDDEDNDIPNDMPNDVSNDCEDDGPDYDEYEYKNPHTLHFSDTEREWWRKLSEELDRTWGKLTDDSDIPEHDLFDEIDFDGDTPSPEDDEVEY